MDSLNGILPSERVVTNKFYDKKIPDFEFIVPAINYQFSDKYKVFTRFKELILSKKPSKQMIISPININPVEFDKKYAEWFDSLNLPRNLDNKDNKYILKFKHLTQYSMPIERQLCWYINTFLYYKFYLDIKRTNLLDYLDRNIDEIYKIKETQNIVINKSSDEELLLISFLYAIRSCNYISDIFTNIWIYSDNAYESQNFRKVTDMHLIYFNGYYQNCYIFNNYSDFVNVGLHIINDMYDYLYDKYKQLSYRKKGINAYYGWQEIKLPEYYVVKCRNSDDFVVYRYDLSK